MHFYLPSDPSQAPNNYPPSAHSQAQASFYHNFPGSNINYFSPRHLYAPTQDQLYDKVSNSYTGYIASTCDNEFGFFPEPQMTVLGDIPLKGDFDPSQQKNLDSSSTFSIDEYFCTTQDNLIMKQSGATEDIVYPQSGTIAINTLETAESVSKDRLNKSEKPGVTAPNSKINGNGMKGWSQEDEDLMRKLAVQYKYDWKKISKKFANKKYTPHFLKMRYKGYDEGPVPKRVKFTHEEDVLIAKYFNEYGVDWDTISRFFTNRTPIMLKNRYYSYIKKHNILENLLEEEQQVPIDEQVSQLIEVNQTKESDGQNYNSPTQEENLVGFPNYRNIERNRKDNELLRLRAQVKSLKYLCLKTQKELKILKNDQNLNY